MRYPFKINTLTIAIPLTCMLVAGSAWAVTMSEEINQSPDVKQFRELDINNDGVLNFSEASKDSFYTKERFTAADKNKDAKLNQQEYSDYKTAQQKKEVGRLVDDSTITAKVKAGIVKEEGLKGLHVSVETYKGIVQLSGFVDSSAQVSKAGAIAKAVEGVKSVKNSLIVK